MMAPLQEPQHKKRHRLKHQAFLLVIVLLLLVGTIIWILNIQGLVPGPWSSIVSAICTVAGVLVALLQWHQPSLEKIPSEPIGSPPFRKRLPHVQLEAINLGVNRRKGALLIKVKKKLVGLTVNLCYGFNNPVTCADIASSVVLRRVDNAPTFVAIFPALEPGNYTVAVHSTQYRTNVTIQAGQIAEIDWRQRKEGRHLK